MALGLLWVSWICFLLFNGSTSFPAMKGYRVDRHNMVEGKVLTSPTFDQNWAPSQQNLPNTPNAPELVRLVNGKPLDLGLENLDMPLLFPLSYQPRTLVGPSLGVASTNRMPATHYAGPAAYYKPATQSPSFQSWQPEPVSSGYGVADFNTDSSKAGGDSHTILVYEDIFHHPSENTKPSQSYGALSNTAGGYGQANYNKGSSIGYASTLTEQSVPSYLTNVGAQLDYPVPSFGMGSPSSSSPRPENLNSGQTAYQPQKLVASTQTEVSQREPIFAPPSPQSYSLQSRSGYQRHKYLHKKSRYLPEFPFPMPLSSKGVKGPGPSQPAAH